MQEPNTTSTVTENTALLISPSLISLPRIGRQVGLCNVLFEDRSTFTRVTACTLAGSPKVTRYLRGFSHFVTSMTAPTASGWSKIAGWDSHPLRNAAFARRTPTPDLHGRPVEGNYAADPENRADFALPQPE